MSQNTASMWRRLRSHLPAGELRFEDLILQRHAGDKWFAAHRPDAVALPRSTRSVVTILRHAHRHRLAVTARGCGFGYVGGCVPAQGGLVLSLARMRRIKEIHATDYVAVVQPGVTTLKLKEAASRQGLFYPPDPASQADCSIGGNIATNAGGPCCLKYGVTREYVLGLQVVLAGGQAVRVGGRNHKDKTGFDLTRLFVGSEGLLGVVTEATLKLLPSPPFRACLAGGFSTLSRAATAIHRILSAGFLPCALEIADAFTLAAAARRTGSRKLRGCAAHLLVELDGQERSVRSDLGLLEAVVRKEKPLFVQRGFGSAGVEAFWRLRREFSYALRDTGLTKLNQDIVVPRSRLVDLFAFTSSLQRRHSLPIACFGHAGDGNIHVNVMIDENDSESRSRSDRLLDELFGTVLAWGGAITGEHGIGLARKPWWSQAVSPEVDAMHRAIKSALDPKGLLNPGKFI